MGGTLTGLDRAPGIPVVTEPSGPEGEPRRLQPGDPVVEARRIVVDVLAEARAGLPGLTPAITAALGRRRDATDDRDRSIRGTWPLATLTGDPWFARQPIEITPPVPEAPLSPRLAEELSVESEAWWALGTIDPDAIFRSLFEARDVERLGRSDRRHVLWLGLALLSVDPDPWSRSLVYRRFGELPSPSVRSVVLSLAFIDLPWPEAEAVVYAATHDTDEPVFITAFRICGRRRDERALDHLLPIVRDPAAVATGLRAGRMAYPVGQAACSVVPAELAILGTDVPGTASQRQRDVLERTRRPLLERVEPARRRLAAAIEAFRQPELPAGPPVGLERMVEIPSGPFIAGVAPDVAARQPFDWSTCAPERTETLPTFFMDRHPVTNAEYDAWAEAHQALAPDDRRAVEHPGQRPGKPHRRNTFDDERFGPDHPVVGIDWFDAWAYARARGAWLPSELEWEKAARGPDGRYYPWGSSFEGTEVHDFAGAFGFEPRSLANWVGALSRATHRWPERTTAPVGSTPAGVSPYGIEDLLGNCWEFTRTAFFTGRDVRPAFAAFTPVELMGSREGHVVIRGGAWSSPAPLLAAAYRGYDLLTDRHTEIGFRCVWAPRPGKGMDER